MAKEMERDSDLFQDDSILLLVDTFHDRRNGYLFLTNPNGARTDALLTDEGRDVNWAWDGVWDVAARRTGQGWVAEITPSPAAATTGSRTAATTTSTVVWIVVRPAVDEEVGSGDARVRLDRQFPHHEGRASAVLLPEADRQPVASRRQEQAAADRNVLAPRGL